MWYIDNVNGMLNICIILVYIMNKSHSKTVMYIVYNREYSVYRL